VRNEPRLHREARREVRRTVAWYEDKREGLGGRFFLAVDARITQVAQGKLPGMTVLLPTAARDIRKVRVKGFPFLLYFEKRGDECVVLAIAHMKRRPGYWLRRRTTDPE
jgi:hypothetical protein